MKDLLVVLAVAVAGAIGYLIAGATGAAWGILIGGTSLFCLGLNVRRAVDGELRPCTASFTSS
jgi:hypothetical protein